MERFGEIDEIENVLLEARSSKSDRGFEETTSDSSVESAGVRDFVNVGSGDFTDRGERVDGRDTLCEQSVGGLFTIQVSIRFFEAKYDDERVWSIQTTTIQ